MDAIFKVTMVDAASPLPRKVFRLFFQDDFLIATAAFSNCTIIP